MNLSHSRLVRILEVPDRSLPSLSMKCSGASQSYRRLDWGVFVRFLGGHVSGVELSWSVWYSQSGSIVLVL